MYKLIPAQEKYLDQIVELIASSGYWIAIRQNNTLGLDPYLFMRDIVAKGYLPFTMLAVQTDNEERVLGMITSTSPLQDKTIPSSFEYFNEKAKELSAPVIKFKSAEEAYEIKIIAVAKSARGQGIGQALFDYAESQAKQAILETLFLFVHSCQNDAIRFYLKNGMMIKNVILLDEIFPSHEMLYLEKNAGTAALLGHFDTAEAQELKLFGIAQESTHSSLTHTTLPLPPP